jgi:LPPG:FO 2-phospho-L-lactate transferase
MLCSAAEPVSQEPGAVFPRIALLTGGFGGARLISALRDAVTPGQLTVITNVGDDLTWFGLRVCPDTDSILYSLAGLWDSQTGWGLRGESFRVRDALAALGTPPWFNVGDRDLAFHLLRASLLRSGLTLTEVTRELARRLGVKKVAVIPASDEPSETHVVLADGRVLHFQEWYVQEEARPPVREVKVARGPASPAALTALRGSDAVILGPSNPVSSIGTILALAGVEDAVRRAPCRIAVSPVVLGVVAGDADIRHHARARERLLAAEQGADTPPGIASRYNGLVQHFVLDRTDSGHVPEIERLGLDSLTCDVLDAEDLARALVSLSRRGKPAQPARGSG